MKTKLLQVLFIVLFISNFSINGIAQIKVACIVDSVTKGYGIKGAGNNYLEQFQTLLGEEYQVGNFGHNGATTI